MSASSYPPYGWAEWLPGGHTFSPQEREKMLPVIQESERLLDVLQKRQPHRTPVAMDKFDGKVRWAASDRVFLISIMQYSKMDFHFYSVKNEGVGGTLRLIIIDAATSGFVGSAEGEPYDMFRVLATGQWMGSDEVVEKSPDFPEYLVSVSRAVLATSVFYALRAWHADTFRR